MPEVTLICNGQEFSFPRSLLCDASPVFQAMFGTGFEESLTGRANLETVEADILQTILSFIATNSIPEMESGDVDFWTRLLEASHLLQMTELSNYCVRQMSEKITPNNFLIPWSLAIFYDYRGFAAKVLTVVASNFDEACQTEDFLRIRIDQLKELVRHPELVISSMDVLVSAVFKWVEFDDDNRQVQTLELLDLLDLSALSKGYLNVLVCHPLAKRSYRVRSRFYSAASGLKHSKSNFRTYTFRKRSPKIYCFGSKKEKQILAIYDINNEQWHPIQEVPFTLAAGMAAAFCGNQIYLAGGCDQDNSNKTSSKIYIYSPETKTFSETRLLSAISHAGAGVMHGYVYMVNGINEKNEATTTVQQYDSVNDSCKRICPTNQGHVRPFVGAYADYLYVVGSCDDSQKNVECYDSFICQWTTLTSIPGHIEWCHATLCRHELFVVRSVCDGAFQIYDLKKGGWEERDFCEPCPCRVWGLWSVYCKDKGMHKIIARDRSHVLQFYNVATETWEASSEPNKNLWFGPQTVVAV